MLRDRYFNSGQEQKEDFRFFDAQVLTDGEILLMLDKTVPGSLAEKWLPSYHFTICDREGHKAGRCDLRIGHNRQLYFGGNIGYQVHEPYRGHHYAAKACRLLFGLALRHDLGYVLITCNPDNLPSRRTCEGLGGELIDIAAVPPDNEMYQRGEFEKCIFRFKLPYGEPARPL